MYKKYRSLILFAGLAAAAMISPLTEAAEPDETAVEEPAQDTASINFTKDDPEILTIIKQYYEAVSTQDAAILSTLVDPWGDIIKNETLGNNIIESYDNISTYSAPGLEDGEYAVFTYYEAKMPDVDTPAPTLVGNYLKTSLDGKLKIYPYHLDTEVSDYLNKLSSDGTVLALISDVQNKYENALSSDPDLKAFIDMLDISSQSAVPGAETEEETEVKTESEIVTESETIPETETSVKKIDTFRGYEWGTTQKKIKGQEITDDMVSGIDYYLDDGYFAIATNVSSYNAQAFFYFDSNDELFQGAYALTEKHSNDNEYLSDYLNLVAIYTKVYGDPVIDCNYIWKGDFYKGREDHYGMAIAVGDLEIITKWEDSDGNSIGARISGDNYKISTIIIYQSSSAVSNADTINTDGV